MGDPDEVSYFSAPEVTDGAPEPRSDLYSLGMTTLTLLDSSPSNGKSADDLRDRLISLSRRLSAPSVDERPDDALAVLGALKGLGTNSAPTRVPVATLVSQGESAKLELKASLRHAWVEPPPGKPESVQRKELEREVVKTVAGFLNARGGTLLVGVQDDGDVTGIEVDFKYFKERFRNRDGWELSFGMSSGRISTHRRLHVLMSASRFVTVGRSRFSTVGPRF